MLVATNSYSQPCQRRWRTGIWNTLEKKMVALQLLTQELMDSRHFNHHEDTTPVLGAAPGLSLSSLSWEHCLCWSQVSYRHFTRSSWFLQRSQEQTGCIFEVNTPECCLRMFMSTFRLFRSSIPHVT